MTERERDRTLVLLRLNGGETLLKSDGKMIPVNTARSVWGGTDTDDVMLADSSPFHFLKKWNKTWIQNNKVNSPELGNL